MNLIISWWSYPAVTVLGKEKIQTVCLHDCLLKIWKHLTTVILKDILISNLICWAVYSSIILKLMLKEEEFKAINLKG